MANNLEDTPSYANIAAAKAAMIAEAANGKNTKAYFDACKAHREAIKVCSQEAGIAGPW